MGLLFGLYDVPPGLLSVRRYSFFNPFLLLGDMMSRPDAVVGESEVSCFCSPTAAAAGVLANDYEKWGEEMA